MRIDKGSPLGYNKVGALKRLNKLNKIFPIGFNNALDYGAGIGAYSLILSEKVKKVVSMDINRNFLSELRGNKKNNIEIVLTSGEISAFRDNSFDSLFAIEVLEHLSDVESGIKEIKRITRKDGVVYITVPNKYFPLETHHVYIFGVAIDGRYVPFLSMNDKIHRKIGSARRFSIKNLSSLFCNEGFELIGSDYIMPPFDNVKRAGKIFRPLMDMLEHSIFKVLSPNIALVFRNRRK